MFWIHLQTICSFRVYHRLLGTSRGLRAGFAIYIGLLSVLVFYWCCSSSIRHRLPVLLKNFPQVTFEKGHLTAPPNPVYAYLPPSDFKIAFDASRQTPPTSAELVQNNWLALVTHDAFYMPESSSVRAVPIPADFSAVTTPDFLDRQQPALRNALRAVAFVAALILVPLVFLFDFCLAAAVGFFFNFRARRAVSSRTIWCWALFLQGPLAALWYVRLWYPIPLFMWAQLILCIIYTQQIFNLIPEESHAH